MTLFPKRDNDPDFSNPEIQRVFIQNTVSAKELLQKELSINQGEQILLNERIRLMSSSMNAVPSSDPHYSLFAVQIKMDQIELDELRVREAQLSNELGEI